ncbi:MAG: hypothetical protein LBR73_06240 [Oscillospiraceae bacterium]|jgi:hypothetical protein|nr:hypothetical protein [Oscillospiraceae bacterium]
MTPSPTFLGNRTLWEGEKTAYLCSEKYPAGAVLRSLDWARAQVKAGCTVISGFQSPLERDVLNILLEAQSPVIIALARGVYTKPLREHRAAFDAGCVLYVSVFPESIVRATHGLAERRNRFVLENADLCCIGYARPGGSLERVITETGVVTQDI